MQDISKQGIPQNLSQDSTLLQLQQENANLKEIAAKITEKLAAKEKEISDLKEKEISTIQTTTPPDTSTDEKTTILQREHDVVQSNLKATTVERDTLQSQLAAEEKKTIALQKENEHLQTIIPELKSTIKGLENEKAVIESGHGNTHKELQSKVVSVPGSSNIS